MVFVIQAFTLNAIEFPCWRLHEFFKFNYPQFTTDGAPQRLSHNLAQAESLTGSL